MSFDWINYLTLARELADSSKRHSNKEALLRCAISRAYYAVFCKSRNYLRDIAHDQNLQSAKNTHAYVIETFVKSRNQTKKGIGDNLRRLRDCRNDADYEDIYRNIEMKTLLCLKYAEQIIDDFQKLNF
jgi:uncharacterized protein (UPF0332 family)